MTLFCVVSELGWPAWVPVGPPGRAMALVTELDCFDPNFLGAAPPPSNLCLFLSILSCPGHFLSFRWMMLWSGEGEVGGGAETTRLAILANSNLS